MSQVKQHYDDVLADVYTWYIGGFDAAKKKNSDFFETHAIKPLGSKRAIDLGSGPGVQAIPLAELGFSVTAIDLSTQLLNELKDNSGDGLDIKVVQDDLLNFPCHCDSEVELIVCMTDTLLHLNSKRDVEELFEKAFAALEKNGKLILTFRDLSYELTELERFIPLRSNEDTIFTCFLEYETETVKVHDLVYRKNNDNWELHKSYFRKMRLSPSWIQKQLVNKGFHLAKLETTEGMVTLIAEKTN